MEKLKRLREERGLSQVKLAARADLNPATVNQIERGMRDASPGTLRKLADALEVSLYELMEEETPKAQAPLPLEEATEAGPEDELARVFSGADNEALIDLYHKVDAERAQRELAHWDNPGDVAKRAAYAEAMQRRMVVLLELIDRGVAVPDPEKAQMARLAEQLEDALGR